MINRIFGYGTNTLCGGETRNHGGQAVKVGEEVLSGYWQRADAGRAVTVRQLVAFHSQGNTETIRRYTKGSTSLSAIFTHEGVESQSMLPHLAGSTTAPAMGSFTTSSLFGF